MKLMHIFFDSDLRGRQPSLLLQAKKNSSFSMDNFGKGDFLAFLNRRQTRIAIIAGLNESEGYGVLAYYRTPNDRKLDIQALKYIPEAFDGREFKMDAALKKSLLERLSK